MQPLQSMIKWSTKGFRWVESIVGGNNSLSLGRIYCFPKLPIKSSRLMGGGCRSNWPLCSKSSLQRVTSEAETAMDPKARNAAWASLINLIASCEDGQQKRGDVVLILKALKLAADAMDQDKEEILPCGRLLLQKSLAMASLLIGDRSQNSMVDADTIAASIVALEVLSGKLSLLAVDSALGPGIASILSDFIELQHNVDKVKVFDDVSSMKVKQMLMASNPRSVMICVVNVWDDLRRCSSLALYKQQQIAMEASMLYAPLAYALGLDDAAHEIDDISFRVLYPQSYKSTSLWLMQEPGTEASSLEAVKNVLEQHIQADKDLNQMIEKVEIHHRVKTLDSFMRKILGLHNLSMGGRKKDDIYDMLGLRVVIYPNPNREEPEQSAIKACYLILKLLHKLWSPVQGRTKDYILHPKPNGYQSLHTILKLSKATDDSLSLGRYSDVSHGTPNMDYVASDIHRAIYESAFSSFGFVEDNAIGPNQWADAGGGDWEHAIDVQQQQGEAVANPNEVFEVQIRTATMDDRCHFGLSAHPLYKSGIALELMTNDQQLLFEGAVASAKLLPE